MSGAGLRVLVCGGRDYADRDAVFSVLNVLQAERGIALLIHGAARGADSLGAEWAASRGIEVLRFPVTPAMWHTQGKKAGPLRNGRMLAEGNPDGVVAFPGGPGTADMIRQAEAAGVKVWRPMASKEVRA